MPKFCALTARDDVLQQSWVWRDDGMMKRKAEILITQSLVDRLAYVDKWPTTRKDSESMYRKSLKRDVEWLLNTRQPLLPELEGYPVAAASVLNFGLPDIQGFHGSDGRDKNALSASLLKTIRTFEPRIKQPRVYMLRTDAASRSLRFHIEGQISFENMQEEISFDTVYELISGDFEVK
jgi:type VI secretion system protein ImpF